MAKTPEGIVKDEIKKALHELHILPFVQCISRLNKDEHFNGYYSMPSSSGMGEAGIADFLICVKGLYVEVEAKSDVGTQSALQRLHEQAVLESGGVYLLIHGCSEVPEITEYLTRVIYD